MTTENNITINMQDVEFSTGKKYNIKESFTKEIITWDI
tara:strand:+ start:1022 stop:1135 length:114 start_codon:yes stop_codon:yes gene_type:complete